MDKNIIKETMLSLEGAALQSAREKYFDYVADARLDRSEPIESDEQAQAEIASVLSEALDDTLHDHTDKLDKSESNDGSAPTRKRYLPEHTASGNLIQPKDFNCAFISTDDLQRLAAWHEAQVAQLREAFRSAHGRIDAILRGSHNRWGKAMSALRDELSAAQDDGSRAGNEQGMTNG
jgi:hypothetical protein